MVYCPNCGDSSKVDWRCPECGRTGIPMFESGKRVDVCPGCGYLETMWMCPGCGKLSIREEWKD